MNIIEQITLCGDLNETSTVVLGILMLGPQLVKLFAECGFDEGNMPLEVGVRSLKNCIIYSLFSSLCACSSRCELSTCYSKCHACPFPVSPCHEEFF